jgi:hypothetical protein
MMSRTSEEGKVPPPQLDKDGNPIEVEDDSKSGISNPPTLEDLMKKLEKLKTENKKLKTKGKKDKTYSTSSEDDDSSYGEEVSTKGRKGKKKHTKPSYKSMSFNYNNIPSFTAYTSVPIGKTPHFNGTNYNQWKYCMKNYLYSVSPKVWQVVCEGVDFLDEDEQPTSDQLQKIHHNLQAISTLTSSIDKEEFNHVDGLDVAKDIWDTLWMAHEGSRPMRKAKIEMIEGQLNRFIMFDDESPQDMFNRLKKMVNKAKALRSKKWNDHMLTEHLMRAYTPMNYNVVTLIRQDLTYKRMTSDDVLGRIINHEMYIEEANHIKNLYKGVTTIKKQEIAFKASKKSKNKQAVVERSSEEEEEDSSKHDADEMTLFMRKFKKCMNRKKFNTKSTSKRMCYNCAKHGYFISNCPFERRDDDDDKKKSKFYKKDNVYKKSDKLYKKSYGKVHIGQK